MRAPQRQLLNRGASILSALVFVSLLSGVAAGVQYFSPYARPESQTAATAETTATKTTKPGVSLKGPDRCNAPIVQKKGPKEGREGVENVCVKGCAYNIYPGTPTKIVAEDSCEKNAMTDAAKKKCQTEGPCNVSRCSGSIGACQPVGGGSEKNKDEILGKAALVPEYFKNDPTIKKLLEDAKTNPAAAQAALLKLDPYMQAAFSEAKDEDQAKMLDKQAENYAAIQRLGEDNAEAKKLAEENKKLAEQNANLNKIDTEKLREEQVVVKAPGKKLTVEDLQKCLKDASLPGCINRSPGSGLPQPRDTFPDPNAGKNPLGSGSDALGALLKGLSNAFKPTPPVAPPAAPPQACSTDQNAYAQQQQQYQQQLQQYNYQLQLYNQQQQQASLYGTPAPVQPAQPTACTPSTGNQCQSQPQQPPASACSAGAWRATYSGACVTGWQCISTAGPKAELSCEPAVADAGSTLAITYGCSSGVASSSSFKVTTQPGGSATTTVKTPPQGTNTATYTLACTDNGKTTGAQCSVQVSRTNIILVANPKTVPAGGTSLLSWLTTGMQSCVISSPDQADFTARNSSNTSVTGAATTSAIAASAQFLLHCETLSGGVRDATMTVSVTP